MLGDITSRLSGRDLVSQYSLLPYCFNQSCSDTDGFQSLLVVACYRVTLWSKNTGNGFKCLPQELRLFGILIIEEQCKSQRKNTKATKDLVICILKRTHTTVILRITKNGEKG